MARGPKTARALARRTAIGAAILAAAWLPCAASAGAAPAVAVSPLNGTPDASPATQISFLGVPAGQISRVSVVGSRSGSHSGRLLSYVSQPGASFLPARGFAQGETVRVRALVGPAHHQSAVGTTFTVARSPNYNITFGTPRELSGRVQTIHSEPSLHPPLVQVTADSSAAASGDMFLTPSSGYGQAGPLILGPQGQLVWFHPVPRADIAADLQVQTYHGQPVLTWWEGRVAERLGVGFGRDEIVNDQYKPIATINAGNGYQADLHEFQLTPQGAAFVTAYTLVDANLSSVGGSSDGVLQDAVLQEIDVATGLVMFEWHAYGHVALSDSYASPPGTPGTPWDFFHLNSLSIDPWGDGNLLISSRNTWTAYEINHISGAIMWRLGGRHSSFAMGPGTGTAWQHDVQWQPDGTLTIFDNGAVPREHSESRAIRERIEWAKKRVVLVSRFSRKILSGSQGDDQVLANGDSFVGWGEAPELTEFSPTGQVLFDAHLPAPTDSYRAYRFEWSATPAGPPAIVAGASTVYASWNGATTVDAWRLLAGASASTLAPVSTVAATGFETAIAAVGVGPYLAVQALDASGQVLGDSATIKR